MAFELRTGLLVAVAIVFMPACLEASTPLSYYMYDRCGLGNTVTFSKDALVNYDRYSHISTRTCQVTFQSGNANTRVQARFRYLDISTGIFGDCTRAGVTIMDGARNLTTRPICGTSPPSDLYRTYTGNRITIVLNNNLGQSTYTDFEIILTAFYFPHSNTTCDAGDFRCENSICVAGSLTCNGYDDCGDDSDELEGCSLAAGVIAGIVISAIVFVFFLSVIGVCVRRRRMTYVRVTETVREYPSVNAQPAGSYIPSYANQSGGAYQTM